MQRESKDNQKGALLVECAMVCSTLFLLFFGVFEIGNGFVTYISLSRVSYEGARIASTTSGLWTEARVCSSGPVIGLDECYLNTGEAAVLPCPVGSSDPHRIIQTSVRDALKVAFPKINTDHPEPWNEIMVTSAFDPDSRIVKVCLSAPVNQDTQVWGLVSLVKTSTHAPYLIRS